MEILKWGTLFLLLTLSSISCDNDDTSGKAEQKRKMEDLIGSKLEDSEKSPLDIELFAADGTIFNLQHLVDKPVVVNFAAIACSTCDEEIDEFNLYFKEHKEKLQEVHLYTIFISIRSDKHEARYVEKAQKITWNHGYQKDAETLKRFCPESKTPCNIMYVPGRGIISRTVGKVSPDSLPYQSINKSVEEKKSPKTHLEEKPTIGKTPVTLPQSDPEVPIDDIVDKSPMAPPALSNEQLILIEKLEFYLLVSSLGSELEFEGPFPLTGSEKFPAEPTIIVFGVAMCTNCGQAIDDVTNLVVRFNQGQTRKNRIRLLEIYPEDLDLEDDIGKIKANPLPRYGYFASLTLLNQFEKLVGDSFPQTIIYIPTVGVTYYAAGELNADELQKIDKVLDYYLQP